MFLFGLMNLGRQSCALASRKTQAKVDAALTNANLAPNVASHLEWRLWMISSLIWWAVVGLIAGWAAGRIMKGGGYGVVMDIVLGILGAVVGGWLMSVFGIHAGGFVTTILVAIVGAVFLIWITRLLKKA